MTIALKSKTVLYNSLNYGHQCNFQVLVISQQCLLTCENVIFVQGRINHKADQAKCLGPTKKVGPTKAKIRKRGLRKPKMREQGPTKVKMKAIDPQKNFAPQKFKKCLGPSRALIQPCICRTLYVENTSLMWENEESESRQGPQVRGWPDQTRQVSLRLIYSGK